MDQTQIQQKIAEHYAKLPSKAQDVFSSMQWLEILKGISTKYKLNDKQIETLGTETTLVLLGIIDLNDYEKILTQEINLPKYSMDEMLVSINDSILNNIRPELMEAFKKNDEVPEEGNENDEEVNTKLDDRFSKLTEETKDAIEKSDYQTKIYEIGQKYNLTVYQIGILGEAVINVMLGITLPNKFEESLKNLELPGEKITEIVNDINEKVFKKIREELVKNIGIKKVEEIKQEPPISPLSGGEEMRTSLDKGRKEGFSENKIDLFAEKELPAGNIEQKPPVSPLSGGEKKGTSLDKGRQEGLEKEVPSILSQKLSGVFKIPTVETEHTLANMTKNTGEEKTMPRIDPYRMPIE